MFIGIAAFVRLELRITSRSRMSFAYRVAAVAGLVGLIVATAIAWSWAGGDWTSPAGYNRLLAGAFTILIFGQVTVACALVPCEIAPVFARARERKTLDAVLGSTLSSVEIVVGAACAGLARYFLSTAAVLPIAILIAALGGFDWRVVGLVYLGLASTTVALAALSVTVATFARGGRRAPAWVMPWSVAWMWLPVFIVLFLPRTWPAAAPWVVPVALRLLDSSPLGVLASALGVTGRGTLVHSLLRMIGLQIAASLLLFSWAAVRLRAACRARHDEASRLRHRARTRWNTWSACGNDPVFWRMRNEEPAVNVVARAFGWLLWIVVAGCLTVGTYWFARPAFEELATRGYGPASRGARFTATSPFAAVLERGVYRRPPAGMARIELSGALREFTLLWELLYLLTLAGIALGGITAERDQDTWVTLLTTPLTGPEILRGKMLGVLWRARWGAVVLVGLWTIGLAAGAVHPAGYVFTLLSFAAATWLYAALAISFALRARDTRQANNRVLTLVMALMCAPLVLLLVPWAGSSVVIGFTSAPFDSYLSLLSYEDVRAALRRGTFPQLRALSLETRASARQVLATCTLGLVAHAGAAWLITRAAFRSFDAIVGRPVRDNVRGGGVPRARG
jgi:hypothetical protein